MLVGSQVGGRAGSSDRVGIGGGEAPSGVRKGTAGRAPDGWRGAAVAGNPGRGCCWQRKTSHSSGRPHGALPHGTEASFWSWGDTPLTKLGLAGPRFGISAGARALKDTPRAGAQVSAFPAPGRFTNPGVPRPRPRANRAARGWEGHPGRP